MAGYPQEDCGDESPMSFESYTMEAYDSDFGDEYDDDFEFFEEDEEIEEEVQEVTIQLIIGEPDEVAAHFDKEGNIVDISSNIETAINFVHYCEYSQALNGYGEFSKEEVQEALDKEHSLYKDCFGS